MCCVSCVFFPFDFLKILICLGFLFVLSVCLLSTEKEKRLGVGGELGRIWEEWGGATMIKIHCLKSSVQ